MEQYTGVVNGMGTRTSNNKNIYLNAHISYKGRSIVIDYEHCLHTYSEAVENDETHVPFEIYPYEGSDIHVGYVELDDYFKKADIVKLLAIVDEALANEPNEM